MSTRLFKWTVENDALSNYFNLNVQGITTISTDRAVSGTKSIKYAPRSTASTNGDTVIRQPLTFTGTTAGDDVAWTSNKTELYFSWQQWLPSFQAGGGAGGHGWRLHPAGDNTKGLDTYALFEAPSGGVQRWGMVIIDTGLNYAIDPPTVWTWNLNAWNHFEMYVKLNTAGSANDILKVWINGALNYNNSAIQLRGGSTSLPTGYGEFALVTNFDPDSPHDGTVGTTLDSSTWYIDDIEIWDGMPGSDTTSPVCTISVPTSSPTYSTAISPLTISGTASDNIAVTSVTWANSMGGSGTATGTTSWSFSAALVSGSNVITVTAHDAASNTGSDIITVTYTPIIYLLRPASTF